MEAARRRGGYEAPGGPSPRIFDWCIMANNNNGPLRTDILRVCERCLRAFWGGLTSKYCRECWDRGREARYTPTAERIKLEKAKILLYRQRFRSEADEEPIGFDAEKLKSIGETEAMDFWQRINKKD